MNKPLICDYCEQPYLQPKVLTINPNMFEGRCSNCLTEDCLKCSYCSTLVDYDYPDIKDSYYLDILLNLDKEEEFICPTCAYKNEDVYSYSYQELENYFNIVNPFEEWGTWGK